MRNLDLQLSPIPIDSDFYGLYHSETFGLTIDPFCKFLWNSVSPAGSSRQLRQGANAVKESFLNQRLLNAQVKMSRKGGRTAQENIARDKRDDKPIQEALA